MILGMLTRVEGLLLVIPLGLWLLSRWKGLDREHRGRLLAGVALSLAVVPVIVVLANLAWAVLTAAGRCRGCCRLAVIRPWVRSMLESVGLAAADPRLAVERPVVALPLGKLLRAFLPTVGRGFTPLGLFLPAGIWHWRRTWWRSDQRPLLYLSAVDPRGHVDRVVGRGRFLHAVRLFDRAGGLRVFGPGAAVDVRGAAGLVPADAVERSGLAAARRSDLPASSPRSASPVRSWPTAASATPRRSWASGSTRSLGRRPRWSVPTASARWSPTMPAANAGRFRRRRRPSWSWRWSRRSGRTSWCCGPTAAWTSTAARTLMDCDRPVGLAAGQARIVCRRAARKCGS